MSIHCVLDIEKMLYYVFSVAFFTAYILCVLFGLKKGRIA